AIPTEKNPYLKKGWKRNKTTVRVGILYMVGLVATLAVLVYVEQPLLLAIIPAALWAAIMTFYALIPDTMYHQSRVHPVISMRAMTLGRISYVTVLFWTIAWLSLTVTPWAAVFYLLLWAVPIFTSFSFFMILRQLVQHGNGDRGWLTNTRVFFVNRLINYAVFPIGQDYHLPHHLFASIPHYRLRQLHEILLDCPHDRARPVVVEGYFLPSHRPPTAPTVLDVLGPEYAPSQFRGVHIDNSVLEDDEVEEREAIIKEGQDEAERLAKAAQAGK